MKRSPKYPCPEPAAIKRARREAGLTQTQAATLIYKALRTWQQYEGGQRKMDPQLWETWRQKSQRIGRKQFAVAPTVRRA